ncbi:MAG: histidine phosphatase family protein [Lachnospiraceae bacterium]|nr:histidine phosphatase family protein [Lachnospiraceae bacterium]
MKLIFIRHADPDYEHDTITEKGHREAALLGQRVKNFKNVKEAYVSPLGRAKDTAGYCLKELGMTATQYDWLQEFVVKVKSPNGEEKHIPWDYMPSYWTKDPCFYDKDHWMESPLFEDSDIKEHYDKVTKGLDGILEKNGYKRSENLYLTDTVNAKPSLLTDPVVDDPWFLTYQVNNDAILFFCHLGVSFVMISHLLGIAPTLLWQTFFVAPTAVTILGAEEREPGLAAFRVQTFGDTSHLLNGHEPISRAGYFTDAYQF